MIYPVQDLTNGQKVESVKYEGKLLSQVHVNQLIQRQRPAVQKTLQFGAAAAPQEFCLFFCFNAFRDGFNSCLLTFLFLALFIPIHLMLFLKFVHLSVCLSRGIAECFPAVFPDIADSITEASGISLGNVTGEEISCAFDLSSGDLLRTSLYVEDKFIPAKAEHDICRPEL